MKLIKLTLWTLLLSLTFTSCDMFSNPDRDGDFELSDDELDDLLDTLVLRGLTELGLEDLGGIFMDSVEYEKIPDTVVVIDTLVIDTTHQDTTHEDTIDPGTQFRSADLTQYFPAILSQGRQGSCTGWASSAIRSYYHNKANNTTNSLTKKRFSPAYIYNRIRVAGCDGGAYTAEAAEFLVNQGDVFEEDQPYDQDQCSEVNQSLEAKAAQYRLSEYRRLAKDVEQMKAWLDQEVPLLVSILVDENFTYLDDSDDYYDEDDFSGSGGGHAIVISGYSDSLSAFQFHNSWGQNWGSEGKAWVSYGATLDILKEVYVVLE